MISRPAIACIALLLTLNTVGAAELTGRFSMLAASARSEPGDLGYQTAPGDYLNADQQGLRLMFDESTDSAEWSAHLRTVRLHTDGLPTGAGHSSSLFRYRELGGELVDEGDDSSATNVRYELDRLYYRHHFSAYTLSLGRQAVDWGSGRFWQPLNVFGAFAPTDIDTDYKPGIDALNLEYYPSAFSSLSAVYAFAPHADSELGDSGALHYRRQLGERSQLALLAGSITGNRVIGASFESVWGGIGWRIEGLHYELVEKDEKSLFWIAGIDYQFDDGTVLSAEYFDNSRGATNESELVGSYDDALIASGLQQQLSRQLVGLGLSRDLTPLMSGSYTLLAARLEDTWSPLHQLNIVYSVSNESDLLASLLLPAGKGLDSADEPRSEFGHLPAAFTLRLRFYF